MKRSPSPESRIASSLRINLYLMQLNFSQITTTGGSTTQNYFPFTPLI